MSVVALDLSKPSFRAAYQMARALAVAGDRRGADALFARLLWHVEARDGGFIGLTDAELIVKCEADPRLHIETVMDAHWSPGQWPSAAAAKQEAA